MITGLVCLELYKVVLNLEIEKYRNSFVNLALPSFVQSEPSPCQVNKSNIEKNIRFYPDGWTLWDSFVVEGDLTFQEFIDEFKNKHKVVPVSVTCGKAIVYNPFFPHHNDRLPLKMAQYVKDKVTSYTIGTLDRFIDLVVLCEDLDGNEVDIPSPVRLKFK